MGKRAPRRDDGPTYSSEGDSVDNRTVCVLALHHLMHSHRYVLYQPLHTRGRDSYDMVGPLRHRVPVGSHIAVRYCTYLLHGQHPFQVKTLAYEIRHASGHHGVTRADHDASSRELQLESFHYFRATDICERLPGGRV